MLETRFKLRVKPRDYQIEAVEWALERKGAVVVMPTGSGKTLIAVLWAKKLLETGEAKRILFLEPTRIMVEQTAKYIRNVLGIEAIPIHGVYPRRKRVELWRKALIAVATPETALSDHEIVVEQGFDSVVVDECHHTTGKDAYAEFMKKTRFKRRLGLTAYIPRSRWDEIKGYIGEIRVWSWEDERIKKYVPPWIGEIYEAELNDAEKKVLDVLEETRMNYAGRLRGLVNTAIRWFVRDGALALKESLEKETSLAGILSHVKPLLEDPRVRPLHKLDALKRILRDHEGFDKAIVFVDRVIVARALVEELSEYSPVAIYGRAKMKTDVKTVLEKACSPDTRVIVSTSAGEEGIDLPEADLLVIWSNVASPIRFIQRHGRILRLVGAKGLKFVAYIVTPDTPDMDSLLDSLEVARKAGVDVPVDQEVLESLWRRTTRSRIIALLEGRPMPAEWISEIANMPIDLVHKALRKLEEKALVFYIYTHLGKTYALPQDIEVINEQYQEYLTPNKELKAKIKPYIENKELKAVTGTYETILSRLKSILKKYGKITKLAASLQIPLPTGALQQVMLHYTFTIEDEKVLETIVKNIFSAEKYIKYIYKTPSDKNNTDQ